MKKFLKHFLFVCILCCGSMLPVQVSIVSPLAFAAETETETTTSDASAWGDITDTTFKIQVADFTPGGTQFLDDDTDGTQGVVNNVLVSILEKLIIIFGVMAAFIMTLGAGYMIIYHGQDDLLSRGKTMFTSGIIAIVIALSAGIIVQIFINLLY